MTGPIGFGGGWNTTAIGAIRPDQQSEGWAGLIDNVFFYSEALTLEQVTALRDRGKGAILGAGGNDPDLRTIMPPPLRNLSKLPAVQSFAYEITNLGESQTLSLSRVEIVGADADRYAVVGFPATLGPGATGSIDFTFDSRGEVGAFAAMLEIESNDATKPLLQLDLGAQVGDDPDLVIVSAPNLGGLAELPAVQSLVFELQNGGFLDDLHITDSQLGGPDAGHYQVVSVPGTLAPGEIGTLELTFEPAGQVGAFSAWLSLASDDPGNPETILSLDAEVIGKALLGFYSFDDSGNPLNDDSGNGRTLQDGVNGGAADPFYNAAGGVAGGAYEYAGAQWLVAPINLNPAQVPVLTMGAWVKTSTLDPGLRKVMGNDNGGWDRVIGLDYRALAAGGSLPDGTFRYACFTGVNNHGPSQGDPPPTPESVNAWTFLAAVYDQPNNEVTLYVDLDVASTNDDPQAIQHETAMGTGATTAGLGALDPNGGESWMGTIDNAFFLAGRANPSDIKTIRDQGKTALLQFRADPVLRVPADPPFGNLPGPQPVTAGVVIENAGQSQTLNLAEVRITGRNASHYAVAPVPMSLAPGATATLQITFDPQDDEGEFQAELDLITDSEAGRHTRLDLSAFVPYGTPLIAFYPFDDPDPLADARGKGADLMVPATGGPLHEPAGGLEGGAYAFDGTQRLISPVSINAARLPQLTMGGWVKTDSLTPGLRKFIGHDDGGWDRAIGLDDRDTGVFRYTTFVGNAVPLPDTPAPTSTDAWSFVAATYDQDSAQVSLYVDLDVSTTGDPLEVTPGSASFGAGLNTTAIGAIRPDAQSEGWEGRIDNVFFYQTVLTEQDLTNIRDVGADAILVRPPAAPVITDVQRTTELTLTWTSVAGRTYHVWYTEALGSAWTKIATQPSQGASTTYTDTDAGRLARPAGFYQVELSP